MRLEIDIKKWFNRFFSMVFFVVLLGGGYSLGSGLLFNSWGYDQTVTNIETREVTKDSQPVDVHLVTVFKEPNHLRKIFHPKTLREEILVDSSNFCWNQVGDRLSHAETERLWEKVKEYHKKIKYQTERKLFD